MRFSIDIRQDKVNEGAHLGQLKSSAREDQMGINGLLNDIWEHKLQLSRGNVGFGQYIWDEADAHSLENHLKPRDQLITCKIRFYIYQFTIYRQPPSSRCPWAVEANHAVELRQRLQRGRSPDPVQKRWGCDQPSLSTPQQSCDETVIFDNAKTPCDVDASAV